METVSFRHTTTHGMVRQIPKPCQIHGGGGDQLRMPSGFRSSKMKAKQSSVGAAAVVKCAAWETGFLKDLGRELEQGGEDWKTLEKCKEEKGMVEVLECLEREAILETTMGGIPVITREEPTS
ncbi:hypothetical protein F3Y22_tig00113302pilonHSYRG00065 [Hibiscus syriacus]|uniref:Uncharacterized protein n=1 Tax=Hibiscus syriacus TaxID=106335 RepID=A0A6A2XKL0_HIBSY|nr:hypothetical protein F3Y22_tig00113302pilonHSYRG00065 [Hibiscus syriacus]